MEFEEDEDDELTGWTAAAGRAELDVLVRRKGDESYDMVSWTLSRYDERWLIDSLNIIS